ncbi:MAG: Rab family GTPase [Promethearchaeota archaeon]
METRINLKIVILGEGEVGKTSIVNAFLDKEIPETYMPTIGSSISKKDYQLKETSIKLSIWDLGGQKSFNPLNTAHYSNADAVLLVFDLTQPKKTLENLKKEFLEKMRYYSEKCISLFIGNKLDECSANKGLINIIKSFLTEKDNTILTSAKTSKNVKDCFELLIYTFLKRAEILNPDIISENTANDFLKFIGKTENSLKNQLIDINSIESELKKIKSKQKVKYKSVTEPEDTELKYYEFIQQELNKVGQQKSDCFDVFLINLSELRKAITHLKKYHIKSVEETISGMKNLLLTSQKESASNFNLLQKLIREENELSIISDKLRQEKIEKDLINFS